MIKFEIQSTGARVATIHESEDQIVEVLQRGDGRLDLIVHNRRGDTDRWDDLSAVLKPEEFADLGRAADYAVCVEKDCPDFGKPCERMCGCHYSWRL